MTTAQEVQNTKYIIRTHTKWEINKKTHDLIRVQHEHTINERSRNWKNREHGDPTNEINFRIYLIVIVIIYYHNVHGKTISIESCSWIDFVSLAYARWYWTCDQTQLETATTNQLPFSCSYPARNCNHQSTSFFLQLQLFSCSAWFRCSTRRDEHLFGWPTV